MFMDNAMRIINSYNENDALKADLAAANATITEQAATIEAMKLCWNCKFIEADRCNKHNCLIDYPMREKCDKWQVNGGLNDV